MTRETLEKIKRILTITEQSGVTEWEECGCCGGYHPPQWKGIGCDCRDDDHRSPVYSPLEWIKEILEDEVVTCYEDESEFEEALEENMEND